MTTILRIFFVKVVLGKVTAYWVYPLFSAICSFWILCFPVKLCLVTKPVVARAGRKKADLYNKKLRHAQLVSHVNCRYFYIYSLGNTEPITTKEAGFAYEAMLENMPQVSNNKTSQKCNQALTFCYFRFSTRRRYG